MINRYIPSSRLNESNLERVTLFPNLVYFPFSSILLNQNLVSETKKKFVNLDENFIYKEEIKNRNIGKSESMKIKEEKLEQIYKGKYAIVFDSEFEFQSSICLRLAKLGCTVFACYSTEDYQCEESKENRFNESYKHLIFPIEYKLNSIESIQKVLNDVTRIGLGSNSIDFFILGRNFIK